jgi:hypothetical protein
VGPGLKPGRAALRLSLGCEKKEISIAQLIAHSKISGANIGIDSLVK